MSLLWISPEETREVASAMLGRNLITKQTGPNGRPVHKVNTLSRHSALIYLSFL